MRTRRLLPLLLAVCLAGVALQPVAGATAADTDRVRVLLFSVDALNPDQLDAVDEGGDPIAPTIRALADSGTVWTEARAVMATETLPNHVAMGTGTYAGTNGIPGNNGRVTSGDEAPTDVDLGLRGTRQATSLVAAIEDQCSDLRTVTAFSKDYVWRTYQDQDAGAFGSDPDAGPQGASEGESDADFYQPRFNIPGSGHAPDATIFPFLVQELQAAPVDHAFVNWGDHDRVGHTDLTGQDPVNAQLRAGQRTALAQVDTFIGLLRQQLEQQGTWDDTVVIVTSDHSMAWRVVDPSQQLAPASIDVDNALTTVAGNEDGSRMFTSLNGGAAFVYLTDPDDVDGDRLLADARAAIIALDGVQEALHREPNPLDAGADVQSVHPDWNIEGTDRMGDLLVTAEAPYAFGTFAQNPLPGNHGHADMRHITAIVSGGWDGIVQQVVEPSDPGLVDVADDTGALPGQVEQVDWAPTIGWLLGVEDPGVAAGGATQWQGRVLEEAFTRRPAAPACAAAAVGDGRDGSTDGGTDEDAGAADPDTDDLAATGAGTALVAAVALAGAALVGRRRGTVERT